MRIRNRSPGGRDCLTRVLLHATGPKLAVVRRVGVMDTLRAARMTGWPGRWATLALAGALHASVAYGQEPTPADSATAAEIRARAAEFGRARVHVDTLLERAFDESSELWEQLEEIEAAYLEAMVELDPETAQRRARLRDLETAYTGAVLADDAVGALVREGAEILGALKRTAAEAGQRPDLSRKVEAFRTDVVARLSLMDPGAVPLLAEAKRLEWLITAHVVGLR